jgi:hypothetical protein
MPCLQEFFSIFFDQGSDPPQFSRWKPEIPRQCQRLKPELRREIVPVHVDMRRFARFVAEEVYAVRTTPQRLAGSFNKSIVRPDHKYT